MGKWLTRVKEKNIKHTLNVGDIVDSVSIVPGVSTTSPRISDVLNKKSPIELCKQVELKKLIIKISDYYGGDDDNFLAEYIHDIQMKNDLDKALVCFRELAAQIIPAKNRK